MKESDELIGQCGLTMQPWKDTEVLEIGYLFNRKFWHQGYATEAAAACKQYAFEVLNAEEVCSIIRDMNLPSQNVARRIGMAPVDSWTKHYRGIDMPHDRFVSRADTPFACRPRRRVSAGSPAYAGLFMRLGFAFLSQFLYHVRVTLWEG